MSFDKPKLSSTMAAMLDTTEIYIARHAESAWPHEFVGGRSNQVPLSDRGEVQAAQLGIYLGLMGILDGVSEVWATPALRTVETARLALEATGLHLPIRINTGLQELTQGPAEGVPRKQIYTPEVLAEIARLQKDFKLPGGESMSEVGARGLAALEEIRKIARETQPNGRIFIFGHGYWVRALVGELENWTHEELRERTLPNTALTKLLGSEAGWSVEFFAKQPVLHL